MASIVPGIVITNSVYGCLYEYQLHPLLLFVFLDDSILPGVDEISIPFDQHPFSKAKIILSYILTNLIFYLKRVCSNKLITYWLDDLLFYFEF